jgi:two-component system response regulator QseB
LRLLLVEDDVILGDGIRAGLKQEGYAVDWIEDGLAAEHALRSEHFDLVLLDINLPRKSGIEVLKTFRDEGKATPVLILTARDGVSDRILGLDCGADDYMVKPFDLDELSARVRALLRRSTGRTTTVLANAELVLDPASHIVTLGEKRLELSQREFVLLQVLMEHMNKVLPRPRLEEALYGWGEEIESNALEVHVHHLRKKLGNDWIRTVRGVGYIMEKHQE